MKTNFSRYVELTKPKVTLLNLLVGATCFILAEYPQVNLPNLCIFLLAGYLAAGGCGVLNCVYDKDIDKLMHRTSARAIPRGFISPFKALIFGTITASVGVAISYFAFNLLTALMMVLGAVFYVGVYTVLLKRSSYWNVVIGGFAGSFAALSGWTAVLNMVSLLPVLVSLVDFLWTPGHLWGLAIKKVRDYKRAGIPMLPVIVGLRKASQIVMLANALTIFSSLLLPIFGLAGIPYMAFAVSAGFWLLFESRRLAVFPSEANGLRVFLASMPYLALLMGGLIVDKILSIF